MYIYIYIFIPTALTPKQQHWFIKVVHTILTQKTVSGLGWNVHNIFINWYTIFITRVYRMTDVISSPNFKPYKCIHVPGIYSYKKEWKTMLIYLMCSHIYMSKWSRPMVTVGQEGQATISLCLTNCSSVDIY